MTKQELLAALRAKLSDLPRRDVEERLSFYGEVIDDRVEEGLSEEAAVAALGALDGLLEEIRAEIPAEPKRGSVPVCEREPVQTPKSKRRLRAWEVVLLALGSPIWLSLIIAAVAIVLSLYVSLWAVVISLWAVFASLVGCGIGGLIGGIGLILGGSAPAGVALIGAALVCAGLLIFTFYGCKAATRGTIFLMPKIVVSIKKSVKKS